MPNKFEPHVPTWRLFVDDITKYVTDQELIASVGGAVYEVWLFSTESATYICSTERMAECFYLGTAGKTSPEDEEARERADEWLRESLTQARAAGSGLIEGHARRLLGNLALDRREHGLARYYYRTARDAFAQAGNMDCVRAMKLLLSALKEA